MNEPQWKGQIILSQERERAGASRGWEVMALHWEAEGKCHLIWALKEEHNLVIERHMEGHFKWQKRPQYYKHLDLQSISEEDLNSGMMEVTKKVTNFYLSKITDRHLYQELICL